MNKMQIDELYHNLRKLNVIEDVQQKEALAGIASHLTVKGGDYNGLLRFLDYYGEKFILPVASRFLDSQRVLYSRVVEFGSGFGWLGRGIANSHGQLPMMFVDKRQWVSTDVVADLETTNGRERILGALKPSDLIVMSELLHCLDNPEKVLKPFAKWPMLVVEYHAWNFEYMKSYNEQIAKFDCVPIGSLKSVFPKRKSVGVPCEPYNILFVYPEE